MRLPKKHMKAFFRGFSTLEILLAGAVFSVFSWGVIETTLGVLEMDRLGQETTVATEYAVEGFNLNAIDYLLKPFTYERFEQSVSKAAEFFKMQKLLDMIEEIDDVQDVFHNAEINE